MNMTDKGLFGGVDNNGHASWNPSNPLKLVIWVFIMAIIIGIAVDQLFISPQFQIRSALSKSINISGINKPPTITNISVCDITENSAIITWKTDIPATSQVAYCNPKSYSCLSDFDASLKIDHSILINGLLPATFYKVSIYSIDTNQRQSELQFINGLTTLSTRNQSKPVITDIKYDESAQSITCTTDKQATCQIKFWCDPKDIYYLIAETDPSTSHIIFINKSGALTIRKYSYQIVAEDGDGNRSDWSSPQTFQLK
jgi:hypothetical protein